ncbi:MAG: phosphoenolpyruvate--protein phosphotransferase [Planctomycetaceae bacterium]|nr:phosphoenolpyruvate--protein phosphotransferase [Planctomycetaceae bacterium]
MLIKRGIAVSPGVVTGTALLLGSEDFRIPRTVVSVDAIDTEIARFHVALENVCKEIAENQRQAAEELGKEYGDIFAAHLAMVRDPKLIEEIEFSIRDRCFSPEFATSRVLRHKAKVMQNLGSHYLAERAADVFDVEKRLLRHLLGERREELTQLTAPVLVLAHNLTPSETANMSREFVLGFATEVGGPTSHTAIMAGALEIPAVVGVGDFLSDVSGGDVVIIDGNDGQIIIDPDEKTQAAFRDSEQKLRTFLERLEGLKELSAETQDGCQIQILGNIEFPEEVDHCNARGAEGIGLYRTEFLYLEKDREPTEDDHFDAYCRVINAFQGRPVVIRTLDLGADKVPTTFRNPLPESSNPMLGLRSIRLSLRNLDLFKVQLRAILRAATRGDVRIMFPLISSLLELRQAKMILADVAEDLEEQGIEFQRDLPVGMMVEVPAAAMLAEEFAREVDFFSIGTNDLIQYTLAADRSDPAVANLYSPGDPSILRLIRMVLAAGSAYDTPVTVCGQMSSDPKFIPLLLGMGLRNLSVTPYIIPELKEVVRNITIAQAEAVAAHALTLDLARDVESYLRGELRKLCPDLVP